MKWTHAFSQYLFTFKNRYWFRNSNKDSFDFICTVSYLPERERILEKTSLNGWRFNGLIQETQIQKIFKLYLLNN